MSYTDNSDGTATDNNTGFMWEVKDNNSGVHDVDNFYTWTTSGTAPDGTLFTDFLDTLNNRCDGDEVTACTSDANCAGIGNGLCGHAGHRDWRIPNIKELQSIVDYGASDARFPAVDPSLPGLMAASNYWSSTAGAGNLGVAWVVNFSFGSVSNVGRNTVLHLVRAVRGGSP